MQLKDTVTLVLLAAATLTTAVGDVPDTCVILAVAVLSSVVGASRKYAPVAPCPRSPI